MSCEFCAGYGRLVPDDRRAPADVVVDGFAMQLAVYDRESGDELWYGFINFCPMCSRDLRGEDA